MRSALLEVRGAELAYGPIEAVHGLDLTVPDGAVVALLGANGAGKTTTLRSIAGAHRPRAGTIELDGGRIDDLGPSRVARLGVCHVPEGRGIFPHLTVRENLMLFAEMAGRDENADGVDRAAQAFPVLGQRMEQQAGTLSGGEQQMLAVSRALMVRPRLLLLDEISMGLAPKLVAELFEQVQALADDGVAILLVEQYVQYALRVADYVYVLAKGRVSFVGEAVDVDETELTSSYLGGVGARAS
jgi:branched-chain amino acid transport system ATP-binding protein